MNSALLASDLLSKLTDVEFLKTGSPYSLLFYLLGLLFVGIVQAVYLAWHVQKDETKQRHVTISNLQED